MKQKSKQAHKETNASHSIADSWFRTTLYSIGDAVITVDKEGIILQMNHIAEELTGWKESDAVGVTINNVFHVVQEDTREPVENPVQKILRHGTIVGLANHTLLISKDGREIPIADSGAPIRQEDGTILGVVLVFRDQTAEREAERKNRESERKLAALMANLPGMSYRCRNDRYWTMEFVSEGCQQLTGYTPDELIDNKRISYNEIIHPDYREYLWNTWQQTLKTNTSFKDEYPIITKDGTRKWVWEQGHGIFSEDGNLLALEGFISDITEKKNVETALQESQQMLESILNTIPVRVFWKDRNGKYLGCNKPFALDAGLSEPDELIGKDDYQMGWIEQAELYRADDREVIESEQPKIGYEEPQTRPDTGKRWLRTSKIPLRDSTGDIVGILGTYEDITERKRAGELLQQSESLFRTVWEESLDGMRLTNEEGTILQVNNAYCRIVGMPREEIEGKPLSVVYSQERADHIVRQHQERFTTHSYIPHVEKELTLRNGKKVWFEVSNSYFTRNGDKPLLLSVFRDITARVQAEKALRESEEKFRSLFEETKDTVYITTPGGKLLDINPAGVETFGYTSKEELQEINIARDLYLYPDDREKYIQKLHKEGFLKDFEITLKRKDGSKFTVLETATVVRDKNNTPVAYRGILRDITKQRALEEQLRQAQKMESIGTLAGGIAHDFNNILSIIVGHASLMKLRPSDPVKLSKGIETILQATQRGTSLVQQLLTYARKSDVKYESVRINDVINEVVQLLHQTLPKIIELNVNLNKNIPSVVADPTQLHQVFLNLTLNARDAMPKGGLLSISSTIVDGDIVRSKFIKGTAREYILVTVSDTGEGMDKWTMQRIFDPFFTTKDPGKGSGLGLALVYSIIESYEGCIDVQSEPGIGTSFKIYFPVQEPGAAVHTTASQLSKKELQGNELILIIEDEEMLLESVRSHLIDYGYSVITARDGEEGIRMYSIHSNDLFGKGIAAVISDIGLPKLGGNEVYRRIKKINPNAKIILASGYIDPAVKLELVKAGAKHFIKKPYTPDQILRTLRTVIDSKD